MKKSSLSLLFILLFLSSCGKKVERNTLNSGERLVFDSLHVLQAESIRKYVDSLCASNRDSLYAIMVDSVLTIRLLEIENIVRDEEEQ